ncbi:aspartate aminotransferase family protein [Jannaschia sp. LMIT008]|uniref:aminotransferase family protein n=1 Tax=Jannaschia maritima TaxID=3032585 RepID=UPI00281141A1|nr:aminotransferase class III-fold pyridoxal phosphate-dependent enzyme [Jannaschia sp. LMIT008]
MNAHLLPFTDPRAAEASPPRRMVRGQGATVWDVDGHAFLDAVSGLWCASLGFAPSRLRDAAARQMDELAYYHSFMGRTCAVTDRLSRELTALLPAGLDHVLYGTSGSEAVEAAVKLARYWQAGRGRPGKTRVIARDGGYHGSLVTSAALTSMAYCHDGFHLPADAVIRVGRPHVLRDADPGEDEQAFAARLVAELEATILDEGPDTICAMIAEPAMGSGGVMLPPEGYWNGVQDVLRRHDILLIADEIITGFGRTGRWFGCQTYGIAPDMMTLAKQLTGAVFPLSAVAMTGRIRDGIADHAHGLGTLGHGVTYGGHPVGAAVALEALAMYREMDLESHVARMGAGLEAAMAPVRALPGVLDVRRVGLMMGVELAPGHAARAAAAAEDRGVLFRLIGDVLGIAPPYVTTDAEIARIGAVMADAVRQTARIPKAEPA